MYSKEKMNLYMKKYRENRSNEAKFFLGNKCVICGLKENLNFDHIYPSKKKYPIGRILTSSKEKLYKELKKCQLLCFCCHKEKTTKESKGRIPWNKGRWKHGSLTGYLNKKCRCIKCKSCYSNYRKEKRKQGKIVS